MLVKGGPGQNDRLFADDVFKCILVNKTFCILNPISLKFVRKGPIDNKSMLVQVMAWCRTGGGMSLTSREWVIYTHIYARTLWHHQLVLIIFCSAPSHCLNQCSRVFLRFFLFLSKCIFLSRKWIWKCRPQNDGHSVSASMCSSDTHLISNIFRRRTGMGS